MKRATTTTNPSPTTSATVRRLKPRTEFDYLEAQQNSRDGFDERSKRFYNPKIRRRQTAANKKTAKMTERRLYSACREAAADEKKLLAADGQYHAARIAHLKKEDAVRAAAAKVKKLLDRHHATASAFVDAVCLLDCSTAVEDIAAYKRRRITAKNGYNRYIMANIALDKRRKAAAAAAELVEYWRQQCHRIINP